MTYHLATPIEVGCIAVIYAPVPRRVTDYVYWPQRFQFDQVWLLFLELSLFRRASE